MGHIHVAGLHIHVAGLRCQRDSSQTEDSAAHEHELGVHLESCDLNTRTRMRVRMRD